MNTTSAGHQHSERCVDLFKQLSAYIDQELDHPTCRQIERHLQHCPPCHACLETLKRTSQLCQKIGDTPVPKALSQRIKKLIQELA